jgi:hypothetical protein
MVLNLKVPHHLQYLNRFGLPEDLVAAELVPERLAAKFGTWVILI